MADRVVDELVVNAVWPGEFDLAYGASIAARVMELDTASDPDKWEMHVWPSGGREMVKSEVPEDMAGYLAGGLEGDYWQVANADPRLSGTASKMGPSSVIFRLWRSDGVFDEELALRLVEACLAGGCEHVYTAVSASGAPLRSIGLDDRYEGDGTMIGYGGITGFNHQIAEVLAPIAPAQGLERSVGEHGVVLHLGTVEPDHRQLQTVLDVIRPVLRPLTLGVSVWSMRNIGNYATDHVRVALDHMRTSDGPGTARARHEFPDVLEHYNKLLEHD